jgi:hypothetical protein
MDARRQYVPNKDHRSDNWTRWRSTAEDNVPDHEAVENLLRPRVGITESSNLMGESNVDREHSEGNVPDSNEEDDDMSVSGGVMGESNVERERSEGNVPDSNEEDDDMSVRSEDAGVTAVQKGKQKMVRIS